MLWIWFEKLCGAYHERSRPIQISLVYATIDSSSSWGSLRKTVQLIESYLDPVHVLDFFLYCMRHMGCTS